MSAASFQLAYTEQAKQAIASLHGSIRKQLRKALERKLAVSPRHYGKPLAGKLAGFWSHRFAAHRVIYRVYED
ncbi:MAG: type II toxin-antitoxin system RelE family toxin, partial [Candidatus Acidiferrales bacterium]